MSIVNPYSIYERYEADSELRDSAKALRVNLEFASIDKEVHCIVITSAEMSVGKSMISIALAMATAGVGKRTLIIDNDFRNPQIASRLKVRSRYTIADLLNGHVLPEKACIPTAVEGLYVLDLGNRRINNPVEIMNSAKYKNIITELSNMFDFIVIDTPPVGMFIDAAVASQMADGVLFVVNSGKTSAKAVKEALGQLEKANVRVLGAVLNNVIRSNSKYYYYYDRQGQKKHRRGGRHSVPEKTRD